MLQKPFFVLFSKAESSDSAKESTLRPNKFRYDLFFSVAGAFICLCLLGQLLLVTQIHEAKWEAPLRKPIYSKALTFGFEQIRADVMWLKYIQNGFKCVHQPSEICDEAWTFAQLDTLIKLDSKFSSPHKFGILPLSLFAQDKTLALKVLKQSQVFFPKEWRYYFMEGYHQKLEMKNSILGHEAFKKAYELGGPEWLMVFSGDSAEDKLNLKQQFKSKYLEAFKQ